MKRLLIVLLLGLFFVSFASATWSNNQFNNSLTTENITLINQTNQTRYLSIPLGTYVTNGTINLNGYNLDRGYNIEVLEFSKSLNIQGVSYNGTFYWVSNITGKTVDRYDSNLNFIDSFDVSSQVTSMRGLTSNGTYIWVIGDSTSNIYKYWINGTYTQDTFVAGSSGNGIDNNDTHLFIARFSGSNSVQTYDMSGNLISQFHPASFRYGVANKDNFLYIGDSTAIDNKYYLDGTNFGSFSVAYNGSNNLARDLDIYTDRLYVPQASTNRVYSYTYEVSNITNYKIYINDTLVFSLPTLVGKNTTGNIYNSINNFMSDCSSSICYVPFIFETFRSGVFDYYDMFFTNDGFIENNQTFNEITTIGNAETFTINIDYDSTEFTNINAILYYNNTAYAQDSLVDNTNNAIISRTINAPLVGSQSNATFYWTIQLTNTTGTFDYNSTMNNQTINPFTIDDCTVNTRGLLNYTLVDEEDQLPLDVPGDNGTIELNVLIYTIDGNTLVTNYSGTKTETNNFTVCISNNFTTASNYSLYSTSSYSGSLYATEYHTIQNMTLDNNTVQQNITLYDLLTASATNFKIIYKDSSFLPVVNAIIKVQRQYVGEGTFKEVESPLTSTQGDAVVHLVRDDVKYNFVISKDGIILATFQNQVAFCEDIISENCIISLNDLTSSGAVFDYEDTVGVSYSITFNTTSRLLSINFATYDGTSKLVNFKAYKNDQLGNSTACDTSLTSSSGTLTCTIPSSIGNESIYYEFYVDGTLTTSGFYNLENPVDYGDSGFFLLLIFVIVFPLMFANSKDWVIFSVMFAFVVALMYGFITGDIIGTGSAVMWLIVEGAILIIINNKGGSNSG